ncbi:DUF3995 domain-containing protein [Sphingosinicella sp. BN140058]|uniref:DUF3995 domain-containing protein n=1 Tax=Sphingosinicella sp. BN140058 TaxID=1892855 RepID=UPI001012C667|nr:DUF3995 domain-containing protein [Sphingosinicella sp. BN140058]QAY78930.1 DUF3995 domain-containing protein [Sphingosinicella sp. BN140058]
MILAAALAIVLFAAAFHVHWALGGHLGYSVSLPQLPDGTPVMAHRLPWWRPAAGGVALCLVCFALLLLTRAGHLHLPLPQALVRFVLLSVGAAFVARAVIPNRYVGLFKGLRTTRWAKYDTRLYSPLFLVLGLLTVWQAMN